MTFESHLFNTFSKSSTGRPSVWASSGFGCWSRGRDERFRHARCHCAQCDGVWWIRFCGLRFVFLLSSDLPDLVDIVGCRQFLPSKGFENHAVDVIFTGLHELAEPFKPKALEPWHWKVDGKFYEFEDVGRTVEEWRWTWYSYSLVTSARHFSLKVL